MAFEIDSDNDYVDFNEFQEEFNNTPFRYYLQDCFGYDAVRAIEDYYDLNPTIFSKKYGFYKGLKETADMIDVLRARLKSPLYREDLITLSLKSSNESFIY